MLENKAALARVLAYHERTKHHYHRFARGPGYMDWENQPDPFRRYAGAPLIHLPSVGDDATPPFARIFASGAVPPRPADIDHISRFFEMALAISAWKEAAGTRWALRCNPSSGNLHPTEGYLLAPESAGLHSSPGVFHYAVREHALELRCAFSRATCDRLLREFPAEAFLLGLSSIHWREAWKYGERAFRYCQHDVGHALAACRLAASALGWRLAVLTGVSDGDAARLLGLDRAADFADAEREHPDLLAAVLPLPGDAEIPLALDDGAIDEIAGAAWHGQANRLSREHAAWDVIDAVAESSWKTDGGVARVFLPHLPFAVADAAESKVTARRIIRQRRSAVAFDGATSIPAAEFYGMLRHVLPIGSMPPWDAMTWPSRLHLFLFVHRVSGLRPGLYCLCRDASRLVWLKENLRAEFAWEKPADCPEELEFFLLRGGDFIPLAEQISCGQAIAGDGAFSLSMAAEFEPALSEFGPWFYRRLFWESGMAGQMLYLMAEFYGVRGTGIGCYFDDAMHEVLGVRNADLQSLYHFTVGGAVEDERLKSYPAYPWSCD